MSFDLVALMKWIGAFLEGAHGSAAAIGVAIGVALSEFIAHMLPPEMNAYAADRLTRLVCFGVSMCSTFALDTTLKGFFLALLAGLAGPTLHGMSLRYVNARWPNLTPKALIECPGDEVRPILPKP